MEDPNRIEIAIPRVFAEDHESRDCPTGAEVKRGTRFVTYLCAKGDLEEWESDADFYKSEARYMAPPLHGLARSAEATLTRAKAALVRLKDLSTVWKSFLETWPDGRIRKARIDNPCDYNRGFPLGHCTATIRKGEEFFDPMEANPDSGGGFGGYRFCRACASISSNYRPKKDEGGKS